MPHSRNVQPYRSLIVSILLLGFGLGFPLLSRYPFREDEAIYGFWALSFWQDPFFLSVWPDKPPVYIGTLALAYKFFGATEASARWLNISFTTLTIALVVAAARHVWGRRAGLLAGATLALNPFALSFAPTAYTDPLLVLLGTAALYAALKQRCWWSGFWLGLAIMTKQQGLLYLPLVLGTLLISTRSVYMKRFPQSWNTLTTLSWFLLGLSTIIAPIVYWDSQRWAVAPSPWDLSVQHYGALFLLPVAHWAAHASGWAALAWYLLASSLLWLFVAAAILYTASQKIVGRVSLSAIYTEHPADDTIRPAVSRLAAQCYCSPEKFRTTSPRAEMGQNFSGQVYMLLLMVWMIGFATVHVLSNIQLWDRYLLPLAAVGALLWGGFLSSVIEKMPRLWGWGVGLIWLLLLCPPAMSAAMGALPLGADHGDYEGLQQAIQWLEQEGNLDATGAPTKKIILYHNVLGWQIQFYLYHHLHNEEVELRWFPSPFYLAHNATSAPHARKFLVTPIWAPVRNLERFAAMHNVSLRQRARFGQIEVVELARSPQKLCTWCYCRETLLQTKAPSIAVQEWVGIPRY